MGSNTFRTGWEVSTSSGVAQQHPGEALPLKRAFVNADNGINGVQPCFLAIPLQRKALAAIFEQSSLSSEEMRPLYG